MERYEITRLLNRFTKQIEDLNNSINPKKLEDELKELNQEMQAPDFWSDSSQATIVTKKANHIQGRLDFLTKITKQLADIYEWFEISEEDSEEWELLESDIKQLEIDIDAFSIEVMLSGQYDYNSAILEIHAGSGGTEAQDWAEMLFRMYQRYSQKKGYKTEIINVQTGDEAGIKSATMLVNGPFAYGYLKAERGVHRLVRISPFDSNARRHTSFSSVEVMPQIDDDVSVNLNEEDIRVDVYRASGAGGQHVNTTDSAVRLTHVKTGIVVTCQNERSQIKNRETAYKLLQAKLMQEEIRKQEEKLASIQGNLKEITWGSQIRSYVFHPYQMVKDHRTNYESSQIGDVMDGDLDEFINEYLKAGDNSE